MDGLTFSAPKLIRNLSSGRADDKAKEYTFSKVLDGLEINYDQFVDLCILMGCDYCDSINGIGGKKGLDLIKNFGTIEEILKEKYDIHEFIDAEIAYNDKIEQSDEELNKQSVFDQSNLDSNDEKAAAIGENVVEMKEENGKSDSNEEQVLDDEIKDEKEKDEEAKDDIEEVKEVESDNEENLNTIQKKGKREKKDPVPKNWLFRGARLLFKEPNVLVNHFTDADLKFKDIDEEGLIQFLCEENGFNEERIKPAINRVKASKGKTNQSRIDSFFKAIPQENKPKSGASNQSSSNNKRSSTGKSSGNKRGKK